MKHRSDDFIMSRKSVRTYDGRKLSDADLDRIHEVISGLSNPFGAEVSFRLLDAETLGLSSPVIAGEKTYVAAVMKRTGFSEAVYGYVFEDFVLKVWELGFGTVWIGGTMNRESFEKAAALTEDEIMPCVTPIGRPAEKRSLRETVMRKGVMADTRKPFEELFFTDGFDTPMSPDSAGGMKEAFELTRWAPSAVNKQPWRIVRKDGEYHFFEKRDKPKASDKTGDLQKIDVGIALRHFTIGASDAGYTPSVVFADPGIETPDGTIYVATVTGC